MKQKRANKGDSIVVFPMDNRLESSQYAEDEEAIQYEYDDDGNIIDVANFDYDGLPPQSKVETKDRKYKRKSASLSRGQLKELIELNTETHYNKYPVALKLDFPSVDITTYKLDPQFRDDVDFPQFRLGFYHWLHASKNKTAIFDQFKEKKRVYRVINGYEPHVDDYDNSIGDNAREFFALSNKPPIVNNSFYKLWEILHYYDIFKGDNFTSVHFAGKDLGCFAQATMFYREKYTKHSKKDKYYGIFVHDDNLADSVNFVEYYTKQKPQQFFLFNNGKSLGDTLTQKNITDIKKFSGTASLITACVKWDNNIVQEQTSAKMIIAQIIAALNLQKKGGTLILKMFENFTQLSCKLLIFLRYFYESLDVIKPLTSRESYSDRYIICQNFKQTDIDFVKPLLDATNTPQYIIDIMPQLVLPTNIVAQITAINIQLANRQFKVINKMVDYIEASNFYGEVYQKYKERQIELSQYWIKQFFSDSSHVGDLLNKGQADSTKLLKQIIIKTNIPTTEPVEIVKVTKTKEKTKQKKSKK